MGSIPVGDSYISLSHARVMFINSSFTIRIYLDTFYYVANSVSTQDEPNPALWLVSQTGKMAQSCPLGITRCIPLCSFFSGVLPRSIKKREKNSVGHYPAILTSRLVNTVYKRYDWTIINRFCRAFGMNVIKQEEEERWQSTSYHRNRRSRSKTTYVRGNLMTFSLWIKSCGKKDTKANPQKLFTPLVRTQIDMR